MFVDSSELQYCDMMEPWSAHAVSFARQSSVQREPSVSVNHGDAVADRCRCCLTVVDIGTGCNWFVYYHLFDNA